MLSKIKSAALNGLDGFEVDVEIDISSGLPAFDIVGLPDTAVKEARERVRAAVKNSNLKMLPKHITINLAPADVKKEGSLYDLAIAMAYLTATEQLSSDVSEGAMYFGELSLNGELRRVNGILPMVISAKQLGIKRVFVPTENAEEAAVVDGIDVLGVSSLSALCDHFSGANEIKPTTIDIDEYFKNKDENKLDFSEVKGQEGVKRALEVAAAGNHNLLMIGSPGSGKTMIAKRIQTILPDMTFDEALEVTKIHSVAGVLSKEPIITKRPFRSPHHTISAIGLAGGGRFPKPGEISLAHNGVLFLDELPEFKRDVLEVMRQPLEDETVTIARVNATLTYPCNVMLVASMNPCKCGYYGDPSGRCRCSEAQVEQYLSKISGPLLDRIDLHVSVSAVEYKDLGSDERAESSDKIKERVNRARKIQQERYKDYKIYSNSQLTPAMIEMFCPLGDAEKQMMAAAYDRLGLSARAHNRILKVARTIADMENSENINTKHLAEAIGYRSLDRNYFKN